MLDRAHPMLAFVDRVLHRAHRVRDLVDRMLEPVEGMLNLVDRMLDSVDRTCGSVDGTSDPVDGIFNPVDGMEGSLRYPDVPSARKSRFQAGNGDLDIGRSARDACGVLGRRATILRITGRRPVHKFFLARAGSP
jgi:hypothetical protein